MLRISLDGWITSFLFSQQVVRENWEKRPDFRFLGDFLRSPYSSVEGAKAIFSAFFESCLPFCADDQKQLRSVFRKEGEARKALDARSQGGYSPAVDPDSGSRTVFLWSRLYGRAKYLLRGRRFQGGFPMGQLTDGQFADFGQPVVERNPEQIGLRLFPGQHRRLCD